MSNNDERLSSDVNEEPTPELTPEEQIMRMSQASNGDNMPPEHKELVKEIFQLLQSEGYSFWDAQMVTGLALASIKAEDPVKVMESATRITSIMMKGLDGDKFMFHPILQKLSESLNAAINKTAMSDIEIEGL